MDKYYRVFAQIDLDAMAHNLKELKSIKDPKAEMMAVIKADGYGHGAVPISKTLIDNGIDRFGVAIVEEGIALRKSGAQIPILIFGYTPTEQLDQVIHYDLIQTVFKEEVALALEKRARALEKIVKIHIKIDTGMGRVGFMPNKETLNCMKRIQELPHIQIEGIYTHFAKADESDKSFTYSQLNTFNEFLNLLEDEGIHIPIKHASNSAGVMVFGEAHFQLIRAGISLYGLYPSDEVDQRSIQLQPALSLKSHIVFIKEVEKNTPIGYGGTYLTPERSIIATIPVGYGDGYPRLLSSKGRVLIRGEYAPIVGRVCMDQFMVDVTHIKGIRDGDEVVLIGQQGDKIISTDEIAKLVGTINYEITCGLGKRIPRIYTSKNERIHSVDYFGI